MLSFKNLLLLFNVTFIYYPTFVKMNVEVMAENFEADFGRFETVGHVRKSATTNSEKPVNASVAGELNFVNHNTSSLMSLCPLAA